MTTSGAISRLRATRRALTSSVTRSRKHRQGRQALGRRQLLVHRGRYRCLDLRQARHAARRYGTHRRPGRAQDIRRPDEGPDQGLPRVRQGQARGDAGTTSRSAATTAATAAPDPAAPPSDQGRPAVSGRPWRARTTAPACAYRRRRPDRGERCPADTRFLRSPCLRSGNPALHQNVGVYRGLLFLHLHLHPTPGVMSLKRDTYPLTAPIIARLPLRRNEFRRTRVRPTERSGRT